TASIAVITSVTYSYCPPPHPELHSFPTRRSSDLPEGPICLIRYPRNTGSTKSPTTASNQSYVPLDFSRVGTPPSMVPSLLTPKIDRKSTRLNSSHEWISYAVFCLKRTTQTRGGAR